MSMFVRVSRRRSVTMLPLVVTVDSVNSLDTLPLSLVVTDDSAVFEVLSLAFGLSATAWTQTTAAANTAPMAATVSFLSFMFCFLSFVSLKHREIYQMRVKEMLTDLTFRKNALRGDGEYEAAA